MGMTGQSVVLVTGADGVIGTRVGEFLRQAGFRVVGPAAADPAEVGPAVADPAAAAAQTPYVIPPGTTAAVHLRLGPEQDQRRLTQLLAAMSDAGVKHVTLVSSASVYGAWPDNSLPLAEDAPVRPNPEAPFAVRHAEAECTVRSWLASPGNTAAILRPAPVVSLPIGGPIGEAMIATASVRVGPGDPPSQFLHLDDLASAVVLAVQKQLTGEFNVAPNGWLTTAELRDLLGARPKMRLPWPLSARLDRYLARRIGHEAPVGILAYTRHAWVIANDRLVAAGWQPRYGNDQAFVHADVGMPWDGLTARQRQYVSLAVSGLVVVAIAVALALWGRRRLIQRRSRHNLEGYGDPTGP